MKTLVGLVLVVAGGLAVLFGALFALDRLLNWRAKRTGPASELNTGEDILDG